MPVRIQITLPNSAGDWSNVVEGAGDYFRDKIVAALPMASPWSKEETVHEADAIGLHSACVVGATRFSLSLTTNNRARGSPPPSIDWELTADATILGRDAARTTLFRLIFVALPLCTAASAWSVRQSAGAAVVGLLVGVPIGLVVAIVLANFFLPLRQRPDPPDARAFYDRVKGLDHD